MSLLLPQKTKLLVTLHLFVSDYSWHSVNQHPAYRQTSQLHFSNRPYSEHIQEIPHPKYLTPVVSHISQHKNSILQTSYIPNMSHLNVSHSGHPTSPTSNILHILNNPTSHISDIFHIPNITHPNHLRSRVSHIPNIQHPQNSTSLTSHILNISYLQYLIFQASYIPNILHALNPTSQTSHILTISHPWHHTSITFYIPNILHIPHSQYSTPPTSYIHSISYPKYPKS